MTWLAEQLQFILSKGDFNFMLSEPALDLSFIANNQARDELYRKYASRLQVNYQLNRTLVSYQASKQTAFYNWFKYKEGFSPTLVEYLLRQLYPTGQVGRMLDPFAGAGAALFAARSQGWQTTGIEVLPVGVYAMNARLWAQEVDAGEFRAVVHRILSLNFSDYADTDQAIKHITITRGAWPPAEDQELAGYVAYCRTELAPARMSNLFQYAAFCVLETISFTRKDGQYLRWDYRAGRAQGQKSFDKGPIPSFKQAIRAKLNQIADDLEGVNSQQQLTFDSVNEPKPDTGPTPILYEGSCLTTLPTLADQSFDLILTSPPYCNRYDYTRTYALELVFLGCSDERVKKLRQAMLSCTVENRSKAAELEKFYAERGQQQVFERVTAVFEEQAALHEVLTILEQYREENKLNNNHLTKLVRNYFYEMCFVIYELARVLKPSGKIVMVDDNVRYAGEEVPVDLILSNMAEAFGLRVPLIWTLERGKGNSSQQMGEHGRSELRKCVYVWEKP